MKTLIVVVAVLIQNLAIAKIEVASKDGLTLFNNMLGDLFNNCAAEFGTIGFWGDDEIFRKLDDETDADIVLLNNSTLFYEASVRRMKFFITVIKRNMVVPSIVLSTNTSTIQIETMFLYVKDDCTKVIIEYESFQFLFESSKIYYCCKSPGQRSIDIQTINTYSDYAPEFWKKHDQIITKDGKVWTGFKAQYSEETRRYYG
ncbi:uncharacterized protein LOC123262488 [Cotesia glomerata]|uniref:uncharacterized protein LOC123262488 n=1 Tax=Cotesia glomerata TaxID=32391 RepID=UPI001D003157|nr:uncharacterized protein LOC123262488 [Cotesia glomerata]